MKRIRVAGIIPMEDGFAFMHRVGVVKKLYEMDSEKFNQKEIFYLCEYIDGAFGTGNGPEFNNNPKYVDSGKYLPEIVKRKEVASTLLLPLEIKEKLLKDMEDIFLV